MFQTSTQVKKKTNIKFQLAIAIVNYQGWGTKMIIYYNFIKCIFGKIINFKLAYYDMEFRKMISRYLKVEIDHNKGIPWLKDCD